MPFGLKNAASTFQRYIDSKLDGVNFAMAYIDDILIFSDNKEDHEKHLHAVLDNLQKAELKVSEAKCKIF